MGEWKPIDTAPKDGTEIIGANNCYVGVFHWDSQGHIRKGQPRPFWSQWFYPQHWSRAHQPTHWLPLPAPPTPQEAGR